jgi:ERF superfamily
MDSELATALARVQAELPAVTKGETAKVEGRDGKRGYEYSYADLADVSAAILPILGQHGLAFTAWPTLEDGKFILAYTLMHKSGEERSGVYPLPSQGTPQQIGGHITYARRYCLCAVTGVAPGGEDSDAAGAAEVPMDRPRAGGGGWANRPLDAPRESAARTRTPTTGADHERLRAGTVEAAPGDRPAERRRGPADDDPWAGEAEDKPGSAQQAQVRGIQMAYKKLSFDPRTDRNRVIATSEQLIGRPLDGPNDGRTHNNLSYNEARKLKDTLDAFGEDRGALLERLAGATRDLPAVDADVAHAAAEGSQDPEATGA